MSIIETRKALNQRTNGPVNDHLRPDEICIMYQ